MNKIKQAYERPKTDLLVVRFEQNILTLSDTGKGGIPNMSEDKGNVTDDSDGWG